MSEARPALTQAPARKALGQHFLHDPDILHRIARATGSVRGDTVIEVGPGPGGLTRALLDDGAALVIAVEADNRFASALETWPEFAAGRLAVVKGDARKMIWPLLIEEAGGRAPAKIIANLPYNVATPLLIQWLKADRWRGAMALMFQKEVAERICAAPGEDAYGRLAVLAQSMCRVRIDFTLPPGAFKPPPKVDSAVVVFDPLEPALRFPMPDTLETVTQAAFGQRRKMLRTSLKRLAQGHGLSPEAWLHGCEIDPRERPENLDVPAFQALARKLHARVEARTPRTET